MNDNIVSGDVLDETITLTIRDLSRACASSAEWIIELVEEGVLEPAGNSHGQWCFSALSLHRARRARRLQQDLRLNLAGVALALDLLDEIDRLQERLGRIGER